MRDRLRKNMVNILDHEDQPDHGEGVFLANGEAIPSIVLRCARVEEGNNSVAVLDKSDRLLAKFDTSIKWAYFAPGTFELREVEEFQRWTAAQSEIQKNLVKELYPKEYEFTEKATRGQEKKTLRELGVEQDEVLEAVIQRQYR